jgi:molybdopterin-containing oxidoreductase family iron-sulfur binding subunit
MGKEEKMRDITRRQFLKLLGLGAGSILMSSYTIQKVKGLEPKSKFKIHERYPYIPPPIPGTRWAMVIDVRACIGCRTCREACFKENNIGRDSQFRYIKVLAMEYGKIEFEHANTEYREAPEPDKWYIPIQCMQCENPECVQACPVTATWKEEDGITVVDYAKCLGCRYCIMNCPYWARHFNWKKPVVPPEEVNPEVPIRPAGVVEKCTFCIHRVRKGREPACVEACPVRARKFGDLNDPNSSVSKLIKSRRVFRLKEEAGTDPRIWYLG